MRAAPTSPVISNPWVLLLLFCGLVGPFALDFHMHYPDEIYYRDAAVKMLQTGDYLTTYLGSGELRFKKPILTYWAVLAGFKLFGVYAFGSRFFFLLAGAATVGLTYLLGKTVFGDRRIAGTAALILCCSSREASRRLRFRRFPSFPMVGMAAPGEIVKQASKGLCFVFFLCFLLNFFCQ